MAAPFHWPVEDAQEALRLKETGKTWREVGALFGKSKSAAEAAVRRYQGYKKNTDNWAVTGDPIGYEISEIQFRKSAKNGSASLRRAIDALMNRMPARLVFEVTGKPQEYIPGTEPILRGQLAERRLAA